MGGVGGGIALIIIGAIVLFALNDSGIPFVSDGPLGIILIAGGVLTIVLGLVLNAQRGRTKHTQENRYEGPPAV